MADLHAVDVASATDEEQATLNVEAGQREPRRSLQAEGPLSRRRAAVATVCGLFALAALATLVWPAKVPAASGEKPEWRDAIDVVREHLLSLHEAGGGRDRQHHAGWSHLGQPMKPTSQKLRELPCVESEGGKLEVTLSVEEAWLEVPEAGVRVRTRLFNGEYPGPLLCFQRGDLVEVHLENELGRNQLPDELMLLRREGQQTPDEPYGIPPSEPAFQDVGQGVRDPSHMQGHANNFHHPDWTNLHIHGMHVSSRQPQDEILYTVVGPGQEFTYRYEIPPYHSSGTSWYHSHLHGSVSLQLGGGMVGGLAILDSPGEVPGWLAEARDVFCMLHELALGYFGPRADRFAPNDPFHGCFPFGSNFTYACAVEARQGLMAKLSGDRLWQLQYLNGFGYGHGQRPPVHHFFAVNGQLSPTLDMKAGEWLRLRMSFGSYNLPVNLVLVAADQHGDDNGCRMYLLTKDNVWVSPAPRLLKKGAWIAPGARAQLLLRCHLPGTYALRNNMSYAVKASSTQLVYAGGLDKQVVLFLNVEGKKAEPRDPEQFKPFRPRYLNDLSQLPGSAIVTPQIPQPAQNFDSGKPVQVDTPFNLLEGDKTITMLLHIDNPHLWAFNFVPQTAFLNQPQRYTINNMTFTLQRPAGSFPVASVVQMHLRGLGQHVWHMHTYPVQLLSFGRSDYLDFWGGFFDVGDWGDTLQLFDYAADPNADELDPTFAAVVRFQTDCYAGITIAHCHVIYHEDAGMMTFFNVTGDEYTYSPNFKNEGPFSKPPPQCLEKGSQCATPRCVPYLSYDRQ